MPAPKNNKFAVGNNGGRPTKLTPELIENARGYIDDCVDEYEQLLKQDGQNSISYDNKLKVMLPSVAGLARTLKVSRDTIYEWQKENKEFSYIIDDIQAEQEKRLLDNGLAGRYNPMITKVILTKHGYADRVETDLTSGGKPIPLFDNVSINNSNKKDTQSE